MNVVSREFSSSNRRVMLFSLHNLLPFAWNGVFYEMMNVIRGMEDATVVAPSPAAGSASLWSNWRGAARATGKKMLAQYAVRTAASAPTSQVEGDFDIAFYACQFPHEIREINCIPHWRERTRKACIFLLESWAYETEKHRAHFRQLDMFDHVFVFNARSVPMIQRHTRATVSYLPTAADTLLLPASRFARERNVDYLCMGRRNNQVHGRMLDICCRNDRFYVFYLWRDMKAKEWASARRQNADMAARAGGDGTGGCGHRMSACHANPDDDGSGTPPIRAMSGPRRRRKGGTPVAAPPLRTDGSQVRVRSGPAG